MYFFKILQIERTNFIVINVNLISESYVAKLFPPFLQSLKDDVQLRGMRVSLFQFQLICMSIVIAIISDEIFFACIFSQFLYFW